MSATIEILSPDGVKLAELGAGEFRLGTRSWCLSEAGDADFDVPRNNSKVRSDYLSLPNLVRIRSSTGVPGWYGPIARVRWQHPEYVNVVCESGETCLARQGVFLASGSPLQKDMTTGAFLKGLIQEALQHGMRGVSLGGQIDFGGPVVSFSAGMSGDLWEDILPQIKKKSWSNGYAANADGAYQFWVDENGLIHWQPRRGRDLRNSLCLHVGAGGVGYTTPVFEIDYRSVVTYGIGLGNAQSASDKIRSDYEDKELSARYGIFDKIVDADLNTTGSAGSAAKSAIHRPERTLDVTVDNWAATWLKFWVGDIVRISEPRSGYPDQGGMLWDCRVTGIEIQEEAERMRVIGKEWTIT